MLIKSILRQNLNNKLSRFISTKPLNILGIETSCDDTSCSIVNSDRKLVSECTISQFEVHEPMGGIVPNLALKNHIKNLPKCVKTTLDRANMTMDDIDVVAVTRGPGLASCLSVGVNASKTLAAALNKPLIGVHHMEAHALTVRFTNETPVEFPYLCLLISGGHTLALIVHNVNEYTQLGSTLDESIGEAYDKTARALNIPWNKPDHGSRGGGPGPALELYAQNGNPDKYPFTTPLSDGYQTNKISWSFSGLRTQVSRRIEKVFTSESITAEEKYQMQCDLAASFQKTAIKHLEHKLKLAFKYCSNNNIKLNSLVASGGVASNLAIRSTLNQLAENNQIPLFCPPPRLCTDNGVMIAWAGYERYRLGIVDNYEFDFMPQWPLEDLKEMYQIKQN